MIAIHKRAQMTQHMDNPIHTQTMEGMKYEKNEKPWKLVHYDFTSNEWYLMWA